MPFLFRHQSAFLMGMAILLTACGSKENANMSPRTELAATVQHVLPVTYDLVPLFFDSPYTGEVLPQGINADGHVAGYDFRPDGSQRAFYYDGLQHHDLGNFGGADSRAHGVNRYGMVAGAAETPDSLHAFVYQGGNIHDIGTLDGGRTTAYAINDLGTATGWSHTQQGARAFIYRNGVMRDVGVLVGGTDSYALDINNSDKIVGYSHLSSGNFHAFLGYAGTMHDLGTLGGDNAKAVAINDRGLIAGFAHTAANDYHAFLSDGRRMRDLGTLGGKASYATGLNAHGVVIGNAFTEAGRIHGFVYHAGKMIDIGTLGGHASLAAAINVHGVVVGRAMDANGQMHAVMWTAAEGLIDLNTRLRDTPPDAFVDRALAVSDNGDIVASGSIGLALLKVHRD